MSLLFEQPLAADRRAHAPKPKHGERWLSGGGQVVQDVPHTAAAMLGVEHSALEVAHTKAQQSGTDLSTELISSGAVTERDYCEAAARALGIGCLQRIDARGLTIRDADGATLLAHGSQLPPVRYLGEDGIPRLVLAPSDVALRRLAQLLAERPGLRGRFALATRSELRRALLDRCGPHLLTNVRSTLFEALPAYSARVVTSGPQGFLLGLVVAAMIGLFLALPGVGFTALHVVASIFFLACVLLRCAAAWTIVAQPVERPTVADIGELPTYTVLVALHREADIVPELLVALGMLWWPRSKLEIKLVCEADDPATIEAIRAHELRSFVEVIEVPSGGPRTKPKALDFALHASSGELVVLFDAEDVPHRFQLLEAWQRFRDSGPDLACVQAPLHITNGESGWLPTMFGFEYRALFRGLLPWLSKHGLVVPLGGTSNHFRRAALDRIGGWDPYNVTEDADLGLRLVRFGYRAETISFPTYETAPETTDVWVRQRTRWFKGWMQTWLVHMRHPVLLGRELGFASFIVAQILFAGMVASALLHPLLLVTLFLLASDLVRGHELGVLSTSLLVLDAINITLGYAGFLVLGFRLGTRQAGENMTRIVMATPVYWMLMSWAAWRALFQLFKDPFLWEKTPHPGGRATVEPSRDATEHLSRGSASRA